MYYLPTSSLILFFLISLFYPFPCASSKQEHGWCEAKFQCGNITAGFPFSGGNRPQICGHPLLELHCFNNTTSIIIPDHLYNVLDIDQTSRTIKLARAELQGSFCNATFTSTTLPSEIFELSSTYKSLTVFYLCDPKLSYHSSYICPGRGPVSVSQNLDYHKSCQGSFMINVPKSFVPEEKELNLAHLESALREGFEVKVKIDEKACQRCSSSHGICGFENTQICCKEASSTRCNKLHPPDATELELHKRCSGPFRCGDQRELFYPFWTSDREGCGHPEFKLNCSGGIAELSISSVKFRILEANYGSGIIRLARLDYINDDLCPQDPIDALFDENILPFAPNTELLTFYYNCGRDFSQRVSTYVGELACGDDSENEKYYYVTTNLSSPLLREIGAFLSDLRGFCNRNVTIPASGPALNELQITSSRDNLKKALEYGFELGPNQECLKCIGSNGVCGYNQSSNSFACYHIEEPQNRARNKGQNNLSILILIGLCSLTGVIAFLVLLCPCFGVQIFLKRKTSDDLRREKLKSLIPLKRYTYAQVKKITKSFAEVIGRGGFGIVYKGTLSDGCMVAVKVLKESKGNDCEDFINEVASMSQTSHVNIVSLLGFCSEGSKRAIIYEFLGNGSLDKFISDKTSMNLDLMALYGIALGVARGLEYLHYGCKTRIVHFDIKPQNVLLDDNLCPKVSDFGLAKLCEKKESILSLLDTRGTIGYIAPEMISRVYGSVSHKSDVYSYGMLVLEMIGARKKEKVDLNSVSNASSIYFPEWIYKDLEKADSEDIEKTYNGGIIENGINNEEEEIVRKMTLVGLWCIQSSPSNRPPMNKVVEMMEGSLEALEVPPRPVLQQISAASLSESFWISEENSSASDIRNAPQIESWNHQVCE